jgi:hypothetical protein
VSSLFPEEPALRGRLTDDLRALLDRPTHTGLTMEQIELELRGRGMAIVAILMAAPFVLPIPLPLLSTPFGLVLCLLGIRLAFGFRPWLPAVLRRYRLDAQTVDRVVRGAMRVAAPLERIARPRYVFLFPAGLQALAGLGITVAASIMAVPLPFPGANALPGLAIVFFGIGLMERDAIMAVAGHVILLFSFVYLYFWWDLVVKTMDRLFPAVL